MQAIKLLHTQCREALPAIHGARMKTLWAATEAALSGGKLWLTALGRNLALQSDVSEKHCIKRIWRLLANRSLHGELWEFYGWMAGTVIGAVEEPTILVDWSPLDDQDCLHVLRAAVAVRGRALPIAELVHERCGDPGVQERLLDMLESVLPAHCRPILATDAGFRCDWFAAVERRGWRFVGRVRNRDLVRRDQDEPWRPNKTLHALATTRPKALGQLWIRKSDPLRLWFYTWFKSPKGRHRHNRNGERCNSGHSNKQARNANEPWLLVSNLEPGDGASQRLARRVVKLFSTRMQIEEGFRDLKAPRNGLALRENLGRRSEHVAVLMLIGALATLVAWLVGLHGYAKGLYRRLMANTEKRRRTLSVFLVGRRLLTRGLDLSGDWLQQALADLEEHVADPVTRRRPPPPPGAATAV